MKLQSLGPQLLVTCGKLLTRDAIHTSDIYEMYDSYMFEICFEYHVITIPDILSYVPCNAVYIISFVT